MPLATKNNAIIVKDGKVAESCGCCKPDCNALSNQVTVTLSGLPRGCTNQFDTYTIGDLSNWNNCSFALTRTTPDRCIYTATLPGFRNYYTTCTGDWTVTLDVRANTLTLGGFLIAKPVGDAFFGRLPFSGQVTAASASTYTLCDFSNLHVTVDTSTPSFAPHTCETGKYSSYAVTCSPCDESAFACYDYSSGSYVDGSYPELTAQLSISKFTIDSFLPRPNPDFSNLPENPGTIPGLKSMSGSYALKWSDAAFYRAQAGALFNSDWTIAGTQYGQTVFPPGGFDTFYSGCGWYGLFYSTPYGQADTGKGYERVFSDGTPLRSLAAVEIAVVPIGWHLPYDYSAKQLTRSRCENGNVAFQVRLKFYMIDNGFADSGYGYYVALGYWNAPLSFFNSSPCQSLSCRGKPTFTISGKVYSVAPCVYMTWTYYYYAQVQGRVSCDVSLSVS